jgi:response regulator RpfG family c-di-GMP phosphodiesterase
MKQATTIAPAAEDHVRVLVYLLDDDPDEILLLREGLDRVCGNDLRAYTDIDGFLKAIEEGVHLAIIDHNLSAGIDGIEVGRRVLQTNEHCALMLASGTQDPRVLREATNSGFSWLLDKNDRSYYEQVAAIVEALLPKLRRRSHILSRYKSYL